MPPQSTRETPVAISPAMITNTIRKTPPTPMPRPGTPAGLHCSCSMSLMMPHKMSRSGQNLPNKMPSPCQFAIPIVPSRNRMPSRISTIAPAIERGRCGAGGSGGVGVITGLATVHLTGSRWRHRRNHFRGRHWRSLWRNSDVPLERRAALEELHASNDQQQNWPGAVEAHPAERFKQKEEPERDQHRRSHRAARTAARALAGAKSSTGQAKVAGKQPASDRDQNERPETVKADLEPHRAQQKQDSKQDEYDRADRNLVGLNLRACAERGGQTIRIGSGQARLNGPSAAN